jgi:hypothetical protein
MMSKRDLSHACGTGFDKSLSLRFPPGRKSITVIERRMLVITYQAPSL